MKSERAMSELLKKVADDCRDEDTRSKLNKVGSAFLTNREVSAQEAAYRLPSLPLKRTSRKVGFVNTSPKDRLISLLKPKALLEKMDDDDDNIFCTSPAHRYAARPDELENSLVEFSATYQTDGRDGVDETIDHIPDVLQGSEEDNDSSADEDTERAGIRKYPSKMVLKHGLGFMRRRNQHCVIRFHKYKSEG